MSYIRVGGRVEFDPSFHVNENYFFKLKDLDRGAEYRVFTIPEVCREAINYMFADVNGILLENSEHDIIAKSVGFVSKKLDTN